MSERLLVLCRHGQSDWNLKNLFTGWKDPDLTPKGVEEASAAGKRLKAKGVSFDLAFTSALPARRRPAGSSCPNLARAALKRSATRRSMSAIMASSPASTRMTPGRSGARSRCMSGGAAMMCPRPAERA